MHPAIERVFTILQKFVIGFVALFTLLIIIGVITDDTPNKRDYILPDEQSAFSNNPDPVIVSDPNVFDAKYFCQDQVEQTLKSPTTADFQPISEMLYVLNGNQYTVTMHVDAQNSYGAVMRSKFVCTAQTNGAGGWRLIDLIES